MWNSEINQLISSKTEFQSVIKQLEMEDYPMPRNNCFYFYLHVRKKGEKNEG